MVEFLIFPKGIFIGFALAVPIGPIGILCIRKTLTEGQLHGLVIGLGAATADFLYGCIAAFGLTAVSAALDSHMVVIRLVGGALLIFIGIKTFFAGPSEPKQISGNLGMLRSYLSTFILTLTNPLTIFAFLGVFAVLGLGDSLSFLSASILVAGVFVGSCLWFLLLSFGAVLFRKKINPAGLRWVNKIAGILIFISGVAAIVSIV